MIMTDKMDDLELQDDILLNDLEDAADDEGGMLYEHFKVVADKGQQPVRVDKFLLEKLQHSSRNRIQKAAEADFIHVNDRPVKSNYKVRPDDVVTLMLDRPRHDDTIIAEDIPLDIVYGDDPIWQSLDVYLPKAAKGKILPVIVSVHGGGWVYGDKKVYQFYCMELAKSGFAVVNYSYRLAPEYRYPAPYEDTNDVFRWLLGNADKYGFDTGNIFGVGDSAGALGMAIYALIVTDKKYAEYYDFTVPEGLVLKGLGLSCGLYKVVDSKTVSTLRDFLRDEDYPAMLERLNVVDMVSSSFPPCFLMTAVGDFLREESAAFAECLA